MRIAMETEFPTSDDVTRIAGQMRDDLDLALAYAVRLACYVHKHGKGGRCKPALIEELVDAVGGQAYRWGDFFRTQITSALYSTVDGDWVLDSSWMPDPNVVARQKTYRKNLKVKEKNRKAEVSPPDGATWDQIGNLWELQANLHGFTPFGGWTAKRQRQWKRRIAELQRPAEDWIIAVQQIGQEPWRCGQTAMPDGNIWKANFEWFLKTGKMVALVEEAGAAERDKDRPPLTPAETEAETEAIASERLDEAQIAEQRASARDELIARLEELPPIELGAWIQEELTRRQQPLHKGMWREDLLMLSALEEQLNAAAASTDANSAT